MLDIHISAGETDRSWLPDGWFEDPGVRGREGYGGRDFLDVDWEMAFGKMDVREEGW